MRRDFRNGQRVALLAAALAARMSAAHMDRRAALKVRQAEVHPPVAAIGRAEQREQRLVLVDRQQLPVAQRPTLRREAEGHDPDLRQKWFGHPALSLISDRTYLTLCSITNT